MWRMYVYAGAGGFLGTGLPLTKCAGSLGPDHFLLSGVGNLRIDADPASGDATPPPGADETRGTDESA